jgi:hypothetical protein
LTIEGLKAPAPVRCTIFRNVVRGAPRFAGAVRSSVKGTLAVIVALAVSNVGTVGVRIRITVDFIVWRPRDIECIVGTSAIPVVVNLNVLRLSDSQDSGEK